MILIDYTGVAIAALFAVSSELDYDNPNIFRHVIINNIKNIRKRFHRKYGDVVLCMDYGSSWRKRVFPYYKAVRKANREKDTSVDWNKVFEYMNTVFDEMGEYFPYKCLKYNSAEADDIIAILANHLDDETLVVSNDKDLAQLLHLPNISVFSPMKDREVTLEDPDFYLFEHVIRGDVSDGVPNIKSQDDSFVIKKRQKSIFAKEIVEWYKNGIPDEYKENFERNKKLISLREIPPEMKEAVISSYVEYNSKRTGKIIDYLIKNKLSNLMDHISDFS